MSKRYEVLAVMQHEVNPNLVIIQEEFDDEFSAQDRYGVLKGQTATYKIWSLNLLERAGGGYASRRTDHSWDKK